MECAGFATADTGGSKETQRRRLAEVGSRSVSELEAERDEVLLGLIELRKKVTKASPPKLRERVL